jgi:Holliday junction resolvase RusA-like endonuclease
MEILDAVVTFEVDGRPVPWARAGRKHGQGSFTPKKVRAYQRRVQAAGIDALDGRTLLEGALLVDLTFYVEIPVSYPLWKKQAAANGLLYPSKLPDIDNLIKGILDALNDKVWKDDKQVVRMDPKKLYSTRPRLEVAIYPIVEITNHADWQEYVAAQRDVDKAAQEMLKL